MGFSTLLITLSGETIKKVEPHLGYIHRSIEKMCESLSYRQFIYVTSRMDYLSSHINNHGCALCVEKGLQIEPTPRAKVIRVLMDELTRLASHQLWWGAMAMDVGALTPFFHAFRESEAINDIMEETCGARLTMNYMVPGGVMFDLHPNFQNRVKEFIRFFKTKIDEYDDLVTGNIIFQSSMKNVGYLSKEDAISYGCTGPTARGSGVSCDIRKLYRDDGSTAADLDLEPVCWRSRLAPAGEGEQQVIADLDREPRFGAIRGRVDLLHVHGRERFTHAWPIGGGSRAVERLKAAGRKRRGCKTRRARAEIARPTRGLHATPFQIPLADRALASLQL